ncbi:MAG: DUF3467 domain-containing protein [Bacteroidaceae bacterium]|nr:DUF3467 domain-containing protein [Bacteroidaceae bacterium]
MEMKKDNQLQIELKEEVAEGIYANLAVIAHSTSEFVVDFIRIMPGVAKAQVKSRVVMTPEHAKRLMFALQDNVKKYEAQFGEIRMPEQRMGYIPGLTDFKGEA